MGKLLEWPGVITEGDDLDDCRELLLEAASEMAELYRDDGRKIPYIPLILESVSVSVPAEVEEEALLVHVS